MKILENIQCYSVPPALDEALDEKFENFNYPIEVSKAISLLNDVKDLELKDWLKVKPNVAFFYKEKLNIIKEIFWNEKEQLKYINAELKLIYSRVKYEKERFMIKGSSLSKNKLEKIKNMLLFVEDLNLVLKLQKEKNVCFLKDEEVLNLISKINREINEFSEKSEDFSTCEEEVKKKAIDNIMSLKNFISLRGINFDTLSRFYVHNDPKLPWLVQLELMYSESNKIIEEDFLEEELKDNVVDQLIFITSLFDKGFLGIFILKLISIELKIFEVIDKLNQSFESEYEKKINSLKVKMELSKSLREEIKEKINNKDKIKEEIELDLKIRRENYDYYMRLKNDLKSSFNQLFDINPNEKIIITISKENESLMAHCGSITLIGVKSILDKDKKESGYFLQTATLENIEANLDISKIKSMCDLDEFSYVENTSFENIESFCNQIEDDFIQDFIFKTSGKEIDLIYI